MNQTASALAKNTDTNSWESAIRRALTSYNNMNKQIPRIIYTSEELFFKEKQNSRYTVKGNMIHELKIFPWFNQSSNPRDSRIRETIYFKKGENIELVTEAINYFKSLDITEEDRAFLEEYYLENGPPSRPLWSIVSLKSTFEEVRLVRQCTGFIQKFFLLPNSRK